MEKNIGKYKILREIGKGGMGIVYKGLDPATQRNVAIKVLPASMVDRSMVTRFQREAMALMKVKHPNLIEVYGVGMTQGQHFFAMEYVEGDTLKAVIKEKGLLSAQETVAISRQVAQGLACIHKEGMIHRDIKPGNIMVEPNGKVKLMDFGLVQISGVTRITVEGSSLGTAEYMSPEQISDEGVDTRSDIYSFGITMYEMIRGKPPFAGESFQSILMKHKYEAPPPVREYRREISEELEKIVNKAMAKDIGQRYQKIEELLQELDSVPGMSPVAEEEKPVKEEGKTEIITPQKEAKPAPERIPKKKSGGKFVVLFLILLSVAGYYFRAQLKPAVSHLSFKLPFFLKGGSSLADRTQRRFEVFKEADQHQRLGRTYYSKKLFDKAIGEYKRAIKLRRDYPLYYKDLAYAYDKKGDYRRALEAWKDLIENCGESATYADTARREIKRLSSK